MPSSYLHARLRAILLEKLPIRLGVLAALLPVALMAAPAQASTTWAPYERHTLGVLDTQLDASGQRTIRNPTDCAWNDQDDIADQGSGSLRAGETTTRTLCLIADYDDSGCPTCIFPKAIVANVYASRGSLASVKLTNDRGNSWTFTPDSKGTVAACVADPVADLFNVAIGGDLSTTYPEVPGSNGGRGLQVNYTLTITAAKRISSLMAYLEIHGGGGNPAFFPQMLQTPCPANDGL
jgi:hypothetical protein